MKRLSGVMWLVLFGSLFLLVAAAPLHAQRPEEDAVRVVENFNAVLLESMKRADELGYSGRYQLLEPAVRESFALRYTAQMSTGRYWRTLTEDQRRLLIEDYTAWSVASYAARFDKYSGERFEVAPAAGTSRDIVNVNSRLIPADGDVVDFSYQLRNIDGRMQIVDVKVSGVSQLALTRSQFVSIMQRRGFNGLIATIRERIDSLSKGRT